MNLNDYDLEKSDFEFTEREARKIARMIDQGATFKEIRSKLSNKHSGMTYAIAWQLGICHAWNGEKAEKVKCHFIRAQKEGKP